MKQDNRDVFLADDRPAAAHLLREGCDGEMGAVFSLHLSDCLVFRKQASTDD